MLRRLRDSQDRHPRSGASRAGLPAQRGRYQASAWAALCGVVAWAAVVPVARAVLSDADTGLDAMDESHYLLAAQPAASGKAFSSLFGWYSAPLWQLSGADLGRFRILGAGILIVAALALAWAVARTAGHVVGREWPLWLRVCWPAAVVSAALNYYTVFVRTPSYNWFASVGLMILAVGVLLILGDARSARSVGPVAALAGAFCALGAFVTAIGKVTTALAATGVLLLVVSVRWLIRRQRPVLRPPLSVAVASAALTSVALLLLHATAVQSLSGTAAVLRRTAGMMAAVDPGAYGAGALRAARVGVLNEVVVRPRLWLPGLALLVIVAVLAAVAVRADWHNESRRLRAGFVVAGAQAALFGAATAAMLRAYPGGVPGLAMSIVPFVVLAESALVVGLASLWLRHRSERHLVGQTLLAVAALTVIGLGYPLGTNVEYATQLPGGVVLLVAAAALGLGLLPGRAADLAVGSTLVGVLAMGAVLVPTTRAVAPYRIMPLPMQTESRVIVPGAAPVRVDAQTAKWVDELRSAAAAGGWVPGTPLFDVTWHPASLVVLQADPPKVLLPAFPGWPDPGGSARYAARQEDPARWRSAWLLVPEGQDDELTDVATQVWGRAFPAGYTRMGVVTAPYDHQLQGLWRPKG